MSRNTQPTTLTKTKRQTGREGGKQDGGTQTAAAAVAHLPAKDSIRRPACTIKTRIYLLVLPLPHPPLPPHAITLHAPTMRLCLSDPSRRTTRGESEGQKHVPCTYADRLLYIRLIESRSLCLIVIDSLSPYPSPLLPSHPPLSLPFVLLVRLLLLLLPNLGRSSGFHLTMSHQAEPKKRLQPLLDGLQCSAHILGKD